MVDAERHLWEVVCCRLCVNCCSAGLSGVEAVCVFSFCAGAWEDDWFGDWEGGSFVHWGVSHGDVSHGVPNPVELGVGWADLPHP